MSNFHKVGGPVDWVGVRSLLYLNVLNLLELLGSCQLSHVGPGEHCSRSNGLAYRVFRESWEIKIVPKSRESGMLNLKYIVIPVKLCLQFWLNLFINTFRNWLFLGHIVTNCSCKRMSLSPTQHMPKNVQKSYFWHETAQIGCHHLCLGHLQRL